MRDAREFSARTGEAMRWFIFTFAVLLPWISLVMLGPWVTIVCAVLSVGFWLWWVYPPVGLNRQPLTWVFTFGLIILCATALLLAAEELQTPYHGLF